MKPLEYYETPIAPLRRPDFTRVFAYKQGTLLFDGPSAEWDLAKGRWRGVVVETHFDEAAYSAHRQERNRDIVRLQEEFKRDVFEQNGLSGHPKAKAIWSFVTEYSDGGGHEAIDNIMSDLAELLK